MIVEAIMTGMVVIVMVIVVVRILVMIVMKGRLVEVSCTWWLGVR